jgi:plastocyanin
MAGGRLFAASLLGIVVASGVTTSLVLAQSGEMIVRQKDISFQPEKIEIKAGSTITFVNEDPFGHNVYSESPGGEFDIGRQQTGQRSPVTFRRAGTFEARCRIHPKMKLEVVVSP